MEEEKGGCMSDIYRKLSEIQQKIKVPKKRENSFGNFKFRNCEDILKEFKKYEKEYSVALLLSDEVVNVGACNYIKATATLVDAQTGESISVWALAKEPGSAKAKMDESQTTGSSSSYARKYALNGMLLLDDSVDVDSDEYVDSGEKASEAQIHMIHDLCLRHNVNLEELYRRQKVKGLPTGAQAGKILNLFKEKFGAD